MKCANCGCEVMPALSMDEYERRARPRLEAIDRLGARLDFSTDLWKYTPAGERYQRLMQQQAADEQAAGL